MAMKTSAAGRAALTTREGVRLEAYRDSRGIPTIGVGHVDATPPVTTMGMTITRAQADALLEADLAPMEAAVNGCILKPISQNAFDASVSLAFNIGAAGFRRSTVARKISAGDMAAAADAFMDWCKPPELRGRREAERQQFLTPDSAPAIAAVPGAPVLNGIIAAVNHAAALDAPSPETTAADVRTLQGNLTTLKLYTGPIDGDFGQATLAAVKAFQAAHGLVPDGVVGDKTFAAIDAALAPPAPAKVTIPPVVAGPHNLPSPATARPWWKLW